MARIHLGPIRRALIVENPDPLLDAQLRAAGVEVMRLAETPKTDALIEVMNAHRVQALFKRSRVPVSRRLLEACPDLLTVQLCCIGDDSVDKRACADHGVMVFNDPVSNGRSVVEMAIGHLIALSRRLYETNAACHAGRWEKSSSERYEIQGKILGVLGLGNIGRGVARAADALGMRIRFYDTRQVAVEVGQEMGWQPAGSIEELLRGSDCVTVHLSARDEEGNSNAGILTLERLEMLAADRPAASPRIFLNLARGFLHSTADLRAAIAGGAIRQAAVDVFPEEPREEAGAWDNPYAGVERVATTPHIGASTLDAQPRIAARVSQTFAAFSACGSLRDCVFAPRSELSLGESPRPGQVLLAVVHSTARGTKRAIDDAIYDAGASNLSSVHRDFADLGVAYDLALIDKPLSPEQIGGLIAQAGQVTEDPDAIRSVRQVVVP